MAPSITTNDLMVAVTGKDGSVIYRLDNAKAASAFLAKMQLAMETFDSKEKAPEVWYYEDGYWHPGGVFKITHLLDKIAGNESDAKAIDDILRRIRGVLRQNPCEFDVRHPYLIGCAGGITLDIKTGKARPAAPTDLISMPIPVTFNPDAKCPEFIKFLKEVMATDDDILTTIDFLASLLISHSMDFFICAPGNGANGRTTLKDFISAFLGEEAIRRIPLSDLFLHRSQ